jgi:glyoxylase-like metal-dependent hydrolase (beta-lactamase superfamily II)
VDAREEDVDAYEAFSRSKGMAITAVIDTHIHADHRSGGPALAARTGAKYCLHESAEVNLSFEPLRDGQLIDLGNTRLQVLHTPGHTPESICLLVTDFKRAPEPWFVLTGDTLFVGAVGRPDLPGHARENSGQLFESIQRKLFSLPEDIEVYPAHFSGSSCGVGLSGKPSSTIGYEKRWNSMLRVDREAFIDKLSNVPDKPAEMEQILAFNSGRTSNAPE